MSETGRNRRALSLSEYGMWMNEQAFPGEAINTIGFRVMLPTHSMETAERAAREVVDRTALFHVRCTEEEGVPYLVFDPAVQPDWSHMEEMPREEAEEVWEREQKKHLQPAHTRLILMPLAEGGSCLIALFHHLVIDGHSLCQVGQMILDRLIGAETDVRYDCFIEAEPMALPEEVQKAEKAFWISYFSDLKAEASILPGTPEHCGCIGYQVDLPREFSARIAAYAGEIGVTESAVFSAALSLYLARCAGTGDAVFLMPRLNRDTAEWRAAVGCRTLVVPVRNRIEEEMTFAALCRLSLEQARTASAHKQYGMGNILRDLHESGIVSDAGLAEYALNYHSGHPTADFPYDFVIGNGGGMHNHLTISISRFGEGIQIRYDGREGIYTPLSVRRCHEALMHILEQGMAAEVPVRDIEIVGTEERETLLQMRGREVPVRADAAIPDLFRDAVAQWPDQPALYAGEVAYTFKELDAVSNRIAHGLMARGIGGGEPVLYKLHRDHRLIPAMFGISKAGAAFVPVDPAYPQGRIDYIQENSHAAWMIVNHEMMEEPAREGLTLLDVDELLATADDTDPGLAIMQEQLAYCIYTSGTTGNPKGVMLSHRGIVNITHPDNNPFNRDIVVNGSGLVAMGSVCFDISLFEFFVPLFNGKFIEFAPEEALADARAIAALIRAHGADILHLTPSRLSAYLQEGDFSAALSGVEVILAAGEVLPGHLVDRLKSEYGIRIYNGYGPTETTIGATITEAGDNLTIGTPIANTGIAILDAAGRLVPFGVRGELCVYGNGVGLGYKGRPQETADRFVTRFGRPMYRTGDLGRYLPDGRIDYEGRNDFQVKIRGLRIELSEIENGMLAYDGINAAVVQVRRIAGSDHLVGFYTVQAGASVDPAALKEDLKRHLTLYMVPDILKELETMPQTPGGKTDLKAITNIPVEYTRTYRAPVSDLQREICEAFATVLKEERVGLDDNYFELGGDSLHTAGLVAEIERRLPGVRVHYEDIFRYPIPEQLAQFLYREQSGVQTGQENPLKALDYTGIDALLSQNTADTGVEQHTLGNILLTGAVGYLGIHILLELLRRPQDWTKIYCLIRPTARQTSLKRLRSRLMYFDEGEAMALIGDRIIVCEGDITSEAVFPEPLEMSIDTVINCAADVSHFAYDDKLERTNTGGVRNLLHLCADWDASFIQVSTISVGGVYPEGHVPLSLNEQDFWIGQEIRNQYILSKYMAEYTLLRAAVDDGIPVKIMRVGNLQGRLSDGEFQINKKSNAFTRQLLSYCRIGVVPRSVYEANVNFAPVDEVARVIVTLAMLPARHTVFHVYPPQGVPYGRLFRTLADLGYHTRVVEDEEFESRLELLRGTKGGQVLLEGILLERPDTHYRDTDVTNTMTEALLEAEDASWRTITDDYLNSYLSALVDTQLFMEELRDYKEGMS
ncbi:MAG: amino acid adenylation domain-containing protein [Butyrivibrio sp.]|nr:amino acid adenylation domain-containing protein [Butyrivibrio sp.]